MNDRQTGYLVIGFLAIFLTAVFSYIFYVTVLLPSRYVVSFDQIGNLRIEDPVLIRGAEIGKVVDLDWNNNRAITTIETNRPLKLFENYLIISVDRGLMGDRILVVDPGLPSAKLVLLTDTLHGKFCPGIAEAIGKAWRLKDIVSTYQKSLKTLLYGSTKENAFVEQFSHFMGQVDSITSSLAQNSSNFDQEISNQVKTLDSQITLLTNYTQKNIDVADQGLDSLDLIISNLKSAVDATDSMLVKVRDYTAKFSDFDTEWALKLSDLRKQLVSLSDGLATLRKTALRLRVHIKL